MLVKLWFNTGAASLQDNEGWRRVVDSGFHSWAPLMIWARPIYQLINDIYTMHLFISYSTRFAKRTSTTLNCPLIPFPRPAGRRCVCDFYLKCYTFNVMLETNNRPILKEASVKHWTCFFDCYRPRDVTQFTGIISAIWSNINRKDAQLNYFIPLQVSWCFHRQEFLKLPQMNGTPPPTLCPVMKRP